MCRPRPLVTGPIPSFTGPKMFEDRTEVTTFPALLSSRLEATHRLRRCTGRNVDVSAGRMLIDLDHAAGGVEHGNGPARRVHYVDTRRRR